MLATSDSAFIFYSIIELDYVFGGTYVRDAFQKEAFRFNITMYVYVHSKGRLFKIDTDALMTDAIENNICP